MYVGFIFVNFHIHVHHGVTYPRTLSFEVLNFRHEMAEMKKKIIEFHKRSLKFLHSWNKTCKTPPTGFFQFILSVK